MEVEKTTYRGALWSVLLTKYYLSDQIKKNEIGGVCCMHGAEARCIKDFGDETLKRETFLRPMSRRSIILKWFFNKRNRTSETGLI